MIRQSDSEVWKRKKMHFLLFQRQTNRNKKNWNWKKKKLHHCTAFDWMSGCRRRRRRLVWMNAVRLFTKPIPSCEWWKSKSFCSVSIFMFRKKNELQAAAATRMVPNSLWCMPAAWRTSTVINGCIASMWHIIWRGAFSFMPSQWPFFFIASKMSITNAFLDFKFQEVCSQHLNIYWPDELDAFLVVLLSQFPRIMMRRFNLFIIFLYWFCLFIA